LAAAHPSNVPARCHALIPTAGTGSRAGTAGPKQYEMLAGRMLVEHTLEAFTHVDRIASVLVVVAPGDERMPGGPGYRVSPCGGATRAASVAGGLADLQAHGARDDDWVLVHDAARCLVTPAQIDRLIDACSGDEVGGLLAQPLADTLKQEDGGRVAQTLPRERKWLAQTPQMFRIGTLRRALAQAGPAVTDEASAIEALGLRPRLVAGSPQNFKVTWPEDFALAEAVFRSRTK
jgi:2-C-methyl-D-erythritol 4-phosphate cytidylyltransferase/2-C-methyl-D-erythritol 4-phosphate cytidylyltransferase/2-C-methyl-D-erythritol 2,4-cyclodiphosphate synthase